MRPHVALSFVMLPLLAACGGAGDVVLAPHGSGTFAAGPTVDLGADIQPRRLALGQFQTGASLDLAVSTIFGLVPLRTGVGDGTFTVPTPDALPVIFSRECVVADFNGDGKDDLAATSDTTGIHVFLGDGLGGLTPAAGSPFTVGLNPFAVALGHVDAGPTWDLVTANAGDGTTTVLLGAGDGTFTSAGSFAVGGAPRGVAAADFDWDGRDDVIVTSSTGTFFLGSNANGTLTSAASVIGAPMAVGTVVTADLNGDGHPDIVVTDRGADLALVRLSTGGGAFSPPGVASLSTGDEPYYMTLADLNGDGRSDLLVSCFTGQVVNVFLGAGDGTFSAQPDLVVGGVPNGVAVGDLNGDGLPDLALAVDDNTGAADWVSIFFALP